ncbi:tRNA (adenosine(37)-N6)-threonylcarbamoyltransferase complex dimerization subunit type 1 TsaB [Thioalkalivibrio sp.]|uniref:tRNA (adenosine(37)-N6)-threonylcarbamoyltransferase complex dimerization subunit type 1 TsaB n=1 Tax=Thioalkalivibrio sp. TaxID=2093813 RepID=UPI00397543E8
MRLIALETATEACSAALWVDGELRWLLEPGAARRHGELILDQVDRLLAEAGLVPGQMDAVAVGRGPGAFTGIRLGLGVAQGLAFAVDCPVIPVSTLAALAQQGADRGARQVLALLDARMGEVYWSLLAVDSARRVGVSEEHLSVPGQIAVAWAEGPRLALGSGLGAYPELMDRLGLRADEVDAGALPCAREVAILAAAAYVRGEYLSPDRAQPVYLRDRVAEPRPNPDPRPSGAGS